MLMRQVNIVLLLALVLAVAWQYRLQGLQNNTAAWLLNYGVSFPIRYVRIEGAFEYLSKDDVKATIEPLILNGFFSADMQSIHRAVIALPWVDLVSVERVWPDAINVKITEKKPYLRWGQKSLMTEDGTVFTPKNRQPFQHLTLLNGPSQQPKKVLEIMKGVTMTLADQAMTLQEFTINNRWSWKLKLKSGLEILLGRSEQLKKLQRFLKTLPLLGQEQVKVMAIVDLRYPNGYAVAWKSQMPPPDWQAITRPPSNR